MATPLAARAQGLDTAGSRAASLSAFVAVADDVTAVVWNPAGLVHGPVFNLALDIGRFTNEKPATRESTVSRGRGVLLAAGVPPLGLSYYRLTTTSAAGPGSAGSPMPDRQDQQVVLRVLTTSHVGVTVLQSLGDYVTVGATAKLVRGSAGGGTTRTGNWNEALERAGALVGRGSTRGDVDVGVMAGAGHVRAGVVVRNVTEPAFAVAGGGPGERVALKRHVRVGLAVGDGWPGRARTILALDADLTRVPHANGDRRDMAAGVERWFRDRRIGARGGLRVSTIGGARAVASGGASVAIRPGAHVDAHVAGGSGAGRSAGVALRLTY
jgi:hypothetical protein